MLESKEDWQNKMQRYYTHNARTKAMAIDRVTKLAFQNKCWDWDDNIPVEWARELAKKWELES